MKTLSIILLLMIGSAQGADKPELDDLVKLQMSKYEVIAPYERMNFARSIERLGLHSQKQVMALKARAAHANKNSYNQKVYSRIQLYRFTFTTSSACKLATDSLLKCFPYDCTSVVNQQNQSLKVTPSIVVFDQNSITMAVTACEQVDEKWIAFKKDFVKVFAQIDSPIIVTECGKLIWTTKEKVNNAP